MAFQLASVVQMVLLLLAVALIAVQAQSTVGVTGGVTGAGTGAPAVTQQGAGAAVTTSKPSGAEMVSAHWLAALMTSLVSIALAAQF